eukprot:s1234_g8.t1
MCLIFNRDATGHGVDETFHLKDLPTLQPHCWEKRARSRTVHNAETKARQHDIGYCNRITAAETAPRADVSLHLAASIGSGRVVVLLFWRLHGGHGETGVYYKNTIGICISIET